MLTIVGLSMEFVEGRISNRFPKRWILHISGEWNMSHKRALRLSFFVCDDVFLGIQSYFCMVNAKEHRS